jgi:hypothetical protein
MACLCGCQGGNLRCGFRAYMRSAWSSTRRWSSVITEQSRGWSHGLVGGTLADVAHDGIAWSADLIVIAGFRHSDDGLLGAFA